MTSKLQRDGSPEYDNPQPKGALTYCQWCGVPLDPTDEVWHCIGKLDHYLVCDGCHEEAAK